MDTVGGEQVRRLSLADVGSGLRKKNGVVVTLRPSGVSTESSGLTREAVGRDVCNYPKVNGEADG